MKIGILAPAIGTLANLRDVTKGSGLEYLVTH